MSEEEWQLLYRLAVQEREQTKFVSKAKAARDSIDLRLRQGTFKDEEEKQVLKVARENLDSLLSTEVRT